MNILNNKSNKYNLINSEKTLKIKKIIPLFSIPVHLKEIKNREQNKFNIKLINQTNNLTSKVINLNEILSIFYRVINLYNLNLNNFLKKENNNKLKLIRELKYDEYNKLNIIYNNYLYLLNRYLPIFKFRTLIYKLGLFAPKRILKYNKLYTYTFRLRSLYLNKKYKYINRFINKKVININIRMVSKLLEKGMNLYLEMISLINKKKLIINNNKLNNLFNPVNNLITNIINKKSVLEELKLQKDQKNNYLYNLNDKKLNLDLNFNNINKNNEINIRNTRKSILNYLNFDEKNDVLYNNYSSPIEVMYFKNNLNNKIVNKPIINQYLKEMSKFNMLRKGIFIYYNKIIGFNFNNNTNKLIKNIYKLLAASFKSMYCLISKPVFIITPDKITIQLFYYLFVPNLFKLKQINLYKKNNKKYKYIKLFRNIKELNKKHQKFKIQISKYRKFKKTNINLLNLSSNVLTKVFFNKFQNLCNILSNLFKKPVELNLIRLHYPYFDSNILVNLLGIMINKIKLRIIIRKLFANTIIKNLNNVNLNRNNNIIPVFLSGINIRVAGRLLTQKVVPRKTVKTIIRGASARSKVNYLDVATYSNKNKRGAFSITVKSGQNYF